MNFPMMPGQNSSGKKGARVVRVPAKTGMKTSPAAICAEVVAVSFPFALGEDAVGVFDDHDGVVDDDTKTEREDERAR